MVTDDILDRHRRLVVGLMMGLASVCVAALWAFERSSGILAALDRYAYPLLLGLFGGGAGIVGWMPRWRERVELAVYMGVSAYFLVALFSFLTMHSDNRLYTVANTLQWLPLMYVVAFVAFPQRQAIATAAALFCLSLVPPTFVTLRGGIDVWDTTLGGLVANAYAVHALLVLMLSFFTLLLRQFEQTRQHARMLEHFAYTDGLTGIPNRRGIEQRLDALSHAPGRCVGLVLLDVDRFKAVNDRFGHQAGDALLRFLAHRLTREVRGGDLLARWGGEEFLVAVPGIGPPPDGGGTAASAADTAHLAERIRQAVCAEPCPASGPVTVSAGTTVWRTGEPLHAALRRADEALYVAKARGRNRVEAR
jgi:diguanylate cyclase (GGDEF)-like protein